MTQPTTGDASKETPKSASRAVIAQQEAMLKALPFEDTADFDDAARGFLGTIENAKITSPQGRVVWSLEPYGFLSGTEAPATVNPSLWRQARLNMQHGLFEVVRGSLMAVPPGQWETTTALSMPWVTKIRRIIWPQAWALMLPGLNNLMVMLVKGTAIASFIALQDLTAVSDDLRKEGVATWTVYGISFVIYYLAAMAFSGALRLLERRAQRRLGIGRTRRLEVDQAVALAPSGGGGGA